MNYISTRGRAPAVGFEDALLAGLAPDGGLYAPEAWPRVAPEEIAAFAGRPFAETAAKVLARFTGDAFTPDRLAAMTAQAYRGFDRPEVAPLTRIGDEDWLLELFHGPTLAFKDVAMQLLGVLFEDVLERRGARLTIVGATSGDTGGAAIEALKGRKRIDVFILHPEGMITEVQRRMMTTADEANVFNIAVQGSFDDCQAIVKSLFADRAFADRVRLSGVNSINWARLAAQTVYYFTAAASLDAPARAASFVVPTGNFGDAFAGYATARMGLPVERICLAVNENDILHRALTTGVYAPAAVTPTSAPSMDIQRASNFERLLFEAAGRDAAAVSAMMTTLEQSGRFEMSDALLAEIAKTFISERAGEEETLAEVKRFAETAGALIDPHTAVGLVALRKARGQGRIDGPAVVLSTAHPAKFPDAVEKATGRRPALPADLADLYDRPEQVKRLAGDVETVKSYILQHARAAG